MPTSNDAEGPDVVLLAAAVVSDGDDGWLEFRHYSMGH